MEKQLHPKENTDLESFFSIFFGFSYSTKTPLYTVGGIILEQVIKRIKRLVNLPEREIERFIQTIKPLQLRAGEELPRQYVGYIDNGLLRAFYRQFDGKDLHREFAIEDDFICYLTLYQTSETEDLVIEAIEDSKLYVMTQEQLNELYKIDPSWEEFGRKIMEEAYMKKCRRERQLLSSTLAGRYQQFKTDYPGLESRLNQHMIASFLGVSPVSLSRHRGDLQKSGY